MQIRKPVCKKLTRDCKFIASATRLDGHAPRNVRVMIHSSRICGTKREDRVWRRRLITLCATTRQLIVTVGGLPNFIRILIQYARAKLFRKAERARIWSRQVIYNVHHRGWKRTVDRAQNDERYTSDDGGLFSMLFVFVSRVCFVSCCERIATRSGVRRGGRLTWRFRDAFVCRGELNPSSSLRPSLSHACVSRGRNTMLHKLIPQRT